MRTLTRNILLVSLILLVPSSFGAKPNGCVFSESVRFRCLTLGYLEPRYYAACRQM